MKITNATLLTKLLAAASIFVATQVAAGSDSISSIGYGHDYQEKFVSIPIGSTVNYTISAFRGCGDDFGGANSWIAANGFSVYDTVQTYYSSDGNYVEKTGSFVFTHKAVYVPGTILIAAQRNATDCFGGATVSINW